MHSIDKEYLRRYLDKYVSKDSDILEVGCGVGNNITLINDIGYKNITGVDISPEMVDIARSKNHEVYLPDDLNRNKKFDVLLFSHVLEHIDYPQIQKTLEYYFELTNDKASVIIIMPLMYDGFYNDVDHIKPYYPEGLQYLFSDKIMSKQYSSLFRLKLLDIKFRRFPLIPYHMECRYKKDLWNKVLFRTITFIAKWAKILSCGLFSKITGYAAIFELSSSNSD